MTSFAYLRISKEDIVLEELNRDFNGDKEKYIEYKLNQQLNSIKTKFNIKEFDYVFRDSGSAFREDKIKNRIEFLALLKLLFNSHITTIDDLFLRNYKHIDMDGYVFDFNRFSRIFEDNLLFAILCDKFNTKLYSVRQGHIAKKEDEKSAEKFTRYLLFSVTAFSSEDYSQNISDNTKKAVDSSSSVTKSSKGNVWGKGFKRINNEKLTTQETEELINFIKSEIIDYEKRKFKSYYKFIIKHVLNKFSVQLSSKSILTNIKKSMNLSHISKTW